MKNTGWIVEPQHVTDLLDAIDVHLATLNALAKELRSTEEMPNDLMAKYLIKIGNLLVSSVQPIVNNISVTTSTFELEMLKAAGVKCLH